MVHISYMECQILWLFNKTILVMMAQVKVVFFSSLDEPVLTSYLPGFLTHQNKFSYDITENLCMPTIAPR